MSTTTRALVTADEFFVLAAASEAPSELVRGEVRVMSMASVRHGIVAGNVYALLRAHVHERRLGACFPDGVGFRLRIPGDVDDSVRSSDAAFVSTARLPNGGASVEGWAPCAPDLAVEVVSPSDTVTVLQEKLDDYFAAGTAVVWVLDPKRWTVQIHTTADAPVRRLRADDTLDGAPALPDFRVPVTELFAGLPRPAGRSPPR